jgi:RNA recognition motif-containing protein
VNRRLYVGNLEYSPTNEELENHLKSLGLFIKIRVIKN